MELQTTPIAEALGATVTGATGADLVEPETAAAVSRALDRYGVLVFPELSLSDDELVELSHRLGEVVSPPHGSIEGHPEIMPITRDPAIDVFAKMRTANDFWHADGTSYERPDKATLLTARHAPDPGEGDTEFASTYAAFEALSEDDKARFSSLRIRHSFAAAQRKAFPDPSEKQLAMWAQVEGREHPLVWRRSDGRSSMVIGSTADSIVGMDEDEGRELIEWLNEWATQPRFVMRHQWHEGDLVIFDNTGLLHRSRPYEADSPRLMHRTTLAGEELVA